MRASQPHSRFGASTGPRDWAEGKANAAGGYDTGLLPIVRRSVTAGERPGTLSAAPGRPQAPCGHAHGGRFLPKTGRGLRAPALLGALVLALSLAGCEADHVGAKDALLEWGYTGIGITTGPMFDRPCRVGQPYAVRFTAHNAAGALRSGWVCASDEFAHDGLIFLDPKVSR